MSKIKEICRENIRYFRKLRGMTQMELGMETDMDASHIGKIERGEINILLTTLKKIADALKVPPSLFLVEDVANCSGIIQMVSSYYNLLNVLPEPGRSEAHHMVVRFLTLEQLEGLHIEKLIGSEITIKYRTIFEKIEKDTGKKILMYGIKALIYKGGSCMKALEIKRICSNLANVCDLVWALNNFQVSLFHFRDVIEDFCFNEYRLCWNT